MSVGEPPKKRSRAMEDSSEQAVENIPRIDDLEAMKVKVRSLATQINPNESLLLLLLQDLEKLAVAKGVKEAPMYQEVSRQARYNQGKIDIPKFVLGILGEGHDVVAKALTKAFKSKKVLKEEDSDTESSPPRKKRTVSPLQDLYPPHQQSAFQPYPYPPYGGYGRGYNRGYSRSFYRGRGRGKPGALTGPACYFCNSTSHFVVDCDKMKEAKGKE